MYATTARHTEPMLWRCLSDWTATKKSIHEQEKKHRIVFPCNFSQNSHLIHIGSHVEHGNKERKKKNSFTFCCSSIWLILWNGILWETVCVWTFERHHHQRHCAIKSSSLKCIGLNFCYCRKKKTSSSKHRHRSKWGTERKKKRSDLQTWKEN